MENPLQSKSFIKAVAKYFMDFLETDFHQRKTPRRAIQLRNADNLLVGIRLSKYPTFSSQAWKLVNYAFKEDILKTLEKGVYHAAVPQNLLDLLTRQVEKLEEASVKAVVTEIANSTEGYAITYKDEITKAIDESVEDTAKILKEKLVQPFIQNLVKPLESLDLADENNVYILTEDLTGVLVNIVKDKISDIVQAVITEDKINSVQELSSVMTIAEVKETILAFFEQFKVNDLFTEVYEVDRNKNILDKQEFYLYFGDIVHNKAKYPIFYIPFSVERRGDSMAVSFDTRVYINKKSLEYIAQEFNKETGKKGSLESIKDRIIYLAQHHEDFSNIIQTVLDELQHFFNLDTRIDVSSPSLQISKGAYTRISNETYIALFDKSDEALINDYEEILSLEEDSELFGALQGLINNFVTRSPHSFWEDVNDEWDNLETSNKLVFQSPIPLNSEQLKILIALNKDDCNYIAVEGPPGTGKSHTITAIVFNAILDNKSVLVLSDKKEALDVVEEKITETMNSVRFDKNFQNPILRLGKSGNTYKQILSPASIDKIKTQYLVVRKGLDGLETNISQSIQGLKEDIEADVVSNMNISLQEVAELVNLETHAAEQFGFVDIQELSEAKNSFINLEELRGSLQRLGQLLSSTHALSKEVEVIGVPLMDGADFLTTKAYLGLLVEIYNHTKSLKENLEKSDVLKELSRFGKFSNESLAQLSGFINEYKSAHKPIVGFLLNGAQVGALDLKFEETFPGVYKSAHKHLSDLERIHSSYEAIKRYFKDKSELEPDKIDYLKVTSSLFNDEALSSMEGVLALEQDALYIEEVIKVYPSTAANAGLNSSFSLLDNSLVEVDELEFDKVLRYLTLYQKIRGTFDAMPVYSYSAQKGDIEKLVTTKMTYLMDEKVVKFQEQDRATAKVLKDIISSKEKFPREEFAKLKQAFPCILSGIRDYAEFIPLDYGLFDLVIIDEASQVSIAQAFPALLRAKKVLILGDRLQFGNVKALQAKSDINTEYLNQVKEVFEQTASQDLAALKKLEYFNIKKSILDFFEFINNYQSMLVKHFRGYRENISFSNKFFYQDQLQVMKIRGKSIDEVIKISVIEHDGMKETRINTNVPEINFIIDQLHALKVSGSKTSVGIITPHTNQQKLAFEMISKLPERDYYFDDLKLKVMTFDTCQGEERDTVFYSMVATREDDKLQHIFSKDLTSRNLESEDDNLRSQRMNVGFSRSKECLHLVLSKPVEEFRGAIGDALLHYSTVIEDAKREKGADRVDQNSPMEKAVLNWFYQTSFWQKNKDSIELNPQFELGKYLRQLDPSYNHPNYKVDFLLIYTTEAGSQKKIVIEYDGFEEHFKNLEYVDKHNYQDYYSNEDVYRQKVLESYGYNFLRINKFNLGAKPVEELDKRIVAFLTNASRPNEFISSIGRTIQGLQNGEMKECPKCGEIKPLTGFKDPSLPSGYGRFCQTCKTKHVGHISKAVTGKSLCPKCGSTMILRRGRHGQFYGCSRFPYCKETRVPHRVLTEVN
jgi:predicted RNA-binding Zn-ribbon protein involved in translation (DUF1610 family)